MKFESFFRSKPKKELEEQVQTIEEKNEIKLTHESIKDEVGLLDVSELKEKYKVRYDAYLEMLRAERRGDDLQESDFYKAKILINALNNLDDYIIAQERGEHRVLRGRQIPVFDEIRNALERGVNAGYVELPTGVGKTVLFTQLIEATNLRSLIAVPKINLVKKTSKEIAKRTTKTSGEYMGKQKDTTKDITTITYDSLRNSTQIGKIEKEDFPLIIIDEAHKALGPETRTAIDYLSGIKLGFTATAEYSKERAVKNILPEEIYTMTLREAIEEGLSCRTKTIHAFTNVDLSSVEIKSGKYDDKQLEKTVNVVGRNMAALELYKNKFSHLKAMINCSGVEHSKEVTRLFQEHGIKAAHIDGTMAEDEQDKIIKQLESGEIMVVTNAKILIEGFDEQSLAVALNLAPTLSFVNAEQRGGRPLRIEDGNPDKWAYVVDFIDANSKKSQILFSEILEDDIIVPEEYTHLSSLDKLEEDKDSTRKIPPINFDDLNINGLRVVVDTKEILRVTREYSESREKWTYETLRQDVLEKEIKSSVEYDNKRKSYGWPVFKSLVTMPEFPKNLDGSNDWDTFLGREKSGTFSYETLRENVLLLGFKNKTEYYDKYREKGWPTPVILTRMREFPKNLDGSPDWDSFLGNEVMVWKYEDLRKEVLQNKIKSKGDYIKKYRLMKWPTPIMVVRMPEFPKDDQGLPDWDTFLERLNFNKIREGVIAAGIKSTTEYGTRRKEFGWPVESSLRKLSEFPNNIDGSPDWDTFFGREKRRNWNYEDLRKDILSKGVRSSHQYIKKQIENNWPFFKALINYPEFPKTPEGQNDWNVFFETEKKKEWTYDELRSDVLLKVVRSSLEYSNKQKENKWITPSVLKRLPEFPKNSDGSPDWDTFLGREKKKEWTYQELKADVISKGVNSSRDYGEKATEFKWPTFRSTTKMLGFPKNSDGSNDWKTFFDPSK